MSKNTNTTASASVLPSVIFIVPYRNRPQHKFFFSNYITSILKGSEIESSYEIYFSHQCDARAFNRGATKNIGFLAVKEKYPNDYQNMTFVFNDIDTIPFSNIFDYRTISGIVKHFYGFKYALGGIVAITGKDFEATNGYPNFWGWGMEDNVLQKRCETAGLIVNRDQFYPIGSADILQLFDGVSRLINKKDPHRATYDNGIDGLQTIHKLIKSIDSESKNPLDNIHTVSSDKIFVINIDTFMTGNRFEHDNYFQYDLREPPRKIIHPDRVKTTKMSNTIDDWSKIPFYPTAAKKQEMIQEYGQAKAEEIIEYSFNNSVDPTVAVMPPSPIQRQQRQPPQRQPPQRQPPQQQPPQQQPQLRQPPQPPSNQQIHLRQQIDPNTASLAQIQQYNQLMQQFNSKTRIIPQNINKFSPAYSRIIAAKPKATASANIRLGGVY